MDLFYFKEKNIKEKKYTLEFDSEFKNEQIKKVLPARLLDIPYHRYCRLCIDIFEAEIIFEDGKELPEIYYPNNLTTRQFVGTLNQALELAKLRHRQTQMVREIDILLGELYEQDLEREKMEKN